MHQRFLVGIKSLKEFKFFVVWINICPKKHSWSPTIMDLKKKKSLVWILRLIVCVYMYKNKNRRKYSGNSHTDKLITSKNTQFFSV